MKRITPLTSKGPGEWFTGEVHPTIVLVGEALSRVRMGSVHFARLAPEPPGTHTLLVSTCTSWRAQPLSGSAATRSRC
jgi:hypothetical protein